MKRSENEMTARSCAGDCVAPLGGQRIGDPIRQAPLSSRGEGVNSPLRWSLPPLGELAGKSSPLALYFNAFLTYFTIRCHLARARAYISC